MALTWNISNDTSNTGKQVSHVIKANKTLHGKMHIAAVNCIVQVMVHRNLDPLIKLTNGLDKSSVYVAGLIKWAIAFGPVTYSRSKNKDGILAHVYKINEEAYATVNRERAVEIASEFPSFWTFSPPPNFNGFDLNAKLQALLKEAEKFEEAKRTKQLRRGKDEVIVLSDDDLLKVNVQGLASLRNMLKGVPSKNSDVILQ